MDKALNEMEIHEAWDLENEMSQILSQLKITDLTSKMKTLSGGQIKRVALAKLLVETRAQHRHTLLIMDEPPGCRYGRMAGKLFVESDGYFTFSNTRPLFSGCSL